MKICIFFKKIEINFFFLREIISLENFLTIFFRNSLFERWFLYWYNFLVFKKSSLQGTILVFNFYFFRNPLLIRQFLHFFLKEKEIIDYFLLIWSFRIDFIMVSFLCVETMIVLKILFLLLYFTNYYFFNASYYYKKFTYSLDMTYPKLVRLFKCWSQKAIRKKKY